MNRYIGISNAARAAGVSAACISRVLNGLSHTSNALVHRAIKKYVTIVEVPEPEYNIPGIKGVKNDREEN